MDSGIIGKARIGKISLMPRQSSGHLVAGRTGLEDRDPLQGALALRGGARPNPISVTVCRLLGIEGDTLRVEGLDLVDGTPVLDVKPYIAHYDAEPKATIPKWARG